MDCCLQKKKQKQAAKPLKTELRIIYTNSHKLTPTQNGGLANKKERNASNRYRLIPRVKISALLMDGRKK